MKRLNWYGFSVAMLLCMAGALANKSVNSLKQWLILVTIIGLPFSIFFLVAGKKDKPTK